MAKFLTTRGTTSEVEKIINNAQKSVVLITPYVSIPVSLFQNLTDADKRGVRITLVYGKKRLERDVHAHLRRLKNLRVYFLENLHAKCYFNELSMVITSLNLYDFSEQKNREMGVLVTRQDDKDVFTEAVQEAQRIMSFASSQDLRHTMSEHSPTKSADRMETSPEETKEEERRASKFRERIFRVQYCAYRDRCDHPEVKSCFTVSKDSETQCVRCVVKEITVDWKCHDCGQEFDKFMEYFEWYETPNIEHSQGTVPPVVLIRKLCRDCYTKKGGVKPKKTEEKAASDDKS